MNFFLLSDNTDTLLGLRFGGIKGIIIKTKQEVIDSLENLKNQENIVLVLITDKLVKLCEEYINNFKINVKKPFVVQIPDRHAKLELSGVLSYYIKTTIGI